MNKLTLPVEKGATSAGRTINTHIDSCFEFQKFRENYFDFSKQLEEEKGKAVNRTGFDSNDVIRNKRSFILTEKL